MQSIRAPNYGVSNRFCICFYTSLFVSVCFDIGVVFFSSIFRGTIRVCMLVTLLKNTSTDCHGFFDRSDMIQGTIGNICVCAVGGGVVGNRPVTVGQIAL